MAFDLNSISKTKRKRAPRVVVYGPAGVGKSTFCAAAPGSIGILTEAGMDAIDSNAFPVCTTLDDVYSAIGTLLSEDHKFTSVYLDSLDWTQPLVWAHVCKANGWSDIEQPGFGKGYVAAEAEWRTLLAGFDELRNSKDMAIKLIAHDQIERYESPTTEGYNIHTLKLQKKATAIVQEWADIIGFASYDVNIKKTDAGFGKKTAKAIGDGSRILYMAPKPAYTAKNKLFRIPEEIPLEWNALQEALDEQIHF